MIDPGNDEPQEDDLAQVKAATRTVANHLYNTSVDASRLMHEEGVNPDLRFWMDHADALLTALAVRPSGPPEAKQDPCGPSINDPLTWMLNDPRLIIRAALQLAMQSGELSPNRARAAMAWVENKERAQ